MKKEKTRTRKAQAKCISGIAFKLVIAFMIPVISVIAVGVVSYQKASEAILYNYQESNRQAMAMTAEYLGFGLETVETNAIQLSMENMILNYVKGKYELNSLEENNAKKNIISSLLAKQVSDHFIENIYILSESKEMLTTGYKSDHSLYQQFIESEAGSELKKNPSYAYWIGSDQLIDNKLSVEPRSYAIRYIRGFGKSNSTIIVDVSTTAVEEILKGLNLGEGSMIGFVNGDGTELITTGKKKGADGTLFATEQFYKKSLAMEQTSSSNYVNWNGSKYLYLNAKVGKTGAMVCALIPYSTIIKQVTTIKNVTIVLVAFTCLIAILIGIGIASGIQRVIQYIIKELKKVSEGNLLIRLNVKRKDEFRILSNGMNEMFVNMRSLIQQVKFHSNSVTDSSAKVKESSELFSNATKEITNAINEIQEGVNQQASDSENCLIQMDDLSKKIEVVSGKTNEINCIAVDTKESILQGIQTMQVLNERAYSTSDITTEIIGNIEKLKEKSISVGNIISTINNIAEETNLLSLNASIEAARAGVAGSGFKVVASQIGKLADQSIEAVQEIEQLILDMQKQTEDVVGIANQAKNVVGEQKSALDNTEQSFQDMNHHVEKLVYNVQMILDSVTNIEVARGKTLLAIENISAVSQQTAAASLAVNEITSHQLEAVSNLNELSIEMDHNAQKLGTVIQQFTID